MLDNNTATPPTATVTTPIPTDTPAPNLSIAPGAPLTLTAPPGTALEIAQLLASGKVDTAGAGKLAKAGNISTLDVANALTTLRAAAEPQVDARTEAEKQVDQEFGPAATAEQFVTRYYTPGQEPPVIPKEIQAFDANCRFWMSEAGLSRELGSSLFTTLSKAIQHTATLTPEQRESHRDSENAKMEKLFGPDWHETKLKPVRAMLDALDQKRPGLKALVRDHGDNAMFLAQLIQTADIYHRRKRR
jgi:hypothetical protein